MSRRGLLAQFLVASVLPLVARAHIGSSDVFFDGKIGPYPARVAIRMPAVVPGRAVIEVRPVTDRPLQISVLPLFSKTAIENSPPPEPAPPAFDEPGLYRGELWLMREGGYGVEVKVHGDNGDGVVQIPVNSVATHQLPFPRGLACILLGLGGVLAVGGLAIVRAAAVESPLPPGDLPDAGDRRKGMVATSISAALGIALLAGGWHWWNMEEAAFRRNLRAGLGPDLTAEARVEGPQRILRLTLGEKAFSPHYTIPLLPDHGKLLHLFLVGEDANGCVAHLHPIRQDGKTFEVALPPLPEGDYRVFADLTLADSAAGSTSTATLHLPPIPAAAPGLGGMRVDPDDSWALCPAAMIPKGSDPAPIYRFEDGRQLLWKAHPPLRARHDAGLQFEARNPAGGPVPLEPYMGMLSHAAVTRADGAVFAHLHPAGNFSMAAQWFFQSKVAGNAAPAGEMDHSKMHHGEMADGGGSTFSLPYEFPSPGDYRVWVQFKTAGQVRTACFAATVAPE